VGVGPIAFVRPHDIDLTPRASMAQFAFPQGAWPGEPAGARPPARAVRSIRYSQRTRLNCQYSAVHDKAMRPIAAG